MKIALVVLMIVHGTIHTMGFIKAFRIAAISQLVNPVQKKDGILWLLAALLFILSAILFSTEIEWWWASSVTPY